MKKVYSSHDPILLGYLKSVLESYGITCLIKNQYLSGAFGELPPTETWPELWVGDDDVSAAERQIGVTLERRQSGSAWTCENCGESLEGQFAACWKCAGNQLNDNEV